MIEIRSESKRSLKSNDLLEDTLRLTQRSAYQLENYYATDLNGIQQQDNKNISVTAKKFCNLKSTIRVQ